MQNNDDHRKALVWSYQILGLKEIYGGNNQHYEELKEHLVNYLDQLIREDFTKLISILYRIDVSQEKAKAALTQKSEIQTAGRIIAELIIARQLQKVKYRRQYGQG